MPLDYYLIEKLEPVNKKYEECRKLFGRHFLINWIPGNYGRLNKYYNAEVAKVLNDYYK